MEEGVINQIKNSQIKDLFDEDQFITSNSGSGFLKALIQEITGLLGTLNMDLYTRKGLWIE